MKPRCSADGVVVAAVRTRTPAAAAGLTAGDRIVAINGHAVRDAIDFQFHAADDRLALAVERDGATRTLRLVAGGRTLGVELEAPRPGEIATCANKCVFCFIHQLPKGMRKSLYVKDDDFRLSFLHGNYITLTDLSDVELGRIETQRLSPLYVSVHATPWEARKVLLNNPRVPDILAQLRRLADGGIQFHGQMVIVPGLNDGDVLEQSLQDLWDFGDAAISVAIVPVGLTQFSHLYSGRSMDQPTALKLLETSERWAKRAMKERGHAWVYGSDELYLLAQRELPPIEYYGDLPQIENGVGSVSALRARIRSQARSLPWIGALRIGVVTGTSMAPLMPELLDQLSATTGAEFVLIPMENSLFGPTTTTAGLLVGADIQRALADRRDLDLALIPAETINDAGVFLDDKSFDAVRSTFEFPVHPSYDFIDVLSEPEQFLSREAAIVAAR